MSSSKNRVLIAICLAIAGCEHSGPIAWEAEREMSAYASPIGDAQKVIFVLNRGDICIPGERVMEKSYGYTEVLCPGKGIGWVADPYFKVYSREHPKGTSIVR